MVNPSNEMIAEINRIERDYHRTERDRLLRRKAKVDAFALLLMGLVVVLGAWEKAHRARP